MTGNRKNEKQSQKAHDYPVESFGQDLTYATTCGQHKPPKPILLPYAVKTLPWSAELIKPINRFGHGISYSQMWENDTALCLQKLAPDLSERVVVWRWCLEGRSLMEFHIVAEGQFMVSLMGSSIIEL